MHKHRLAARPDVEPTRTVTPQDGTHTTETLGELLALQSQSLVPTDGVHGPPYSYWTTDHDAAATTPVRVDYKRDGITTLTKTDYTPDTATTSTLPEQQLAIEAYATAPETVFDELTETLVGGLANHKDIIDEQTPVWKFPEFHHLSLTNPSFQLSAAGVDADALTVATDIITHLLEDRLDISGYLLVYHPYRIKQGKRHDKYNHAGATGTGTHTWDTLVPELAQATPAARGEIRETVLKQDGHFHVFAIADEIDYTECAAIHEETGWLCHRIEKGDSTCSVTDVGDLAGQLRHILTHAGVTETDTSADSHTGTTSVLPTIQIRNEKLLETVDETTVNTINSN